MYYKNNFKRNRFSIRNSGSQNSFGRPSNGGGRFNNSRFSSNNRQGGQRRSQLEGADINIFMKKAAPIAFEQENVMNNSFEDFNIAEILKQNIVKRGFSQPTPIQAQAIK